MRQCFIYISLSSTFVMRLRRQIWTTPYTNTNFRLPSDNAINPTETKVSHRSVDEVKIIKQRITS